MFDHVGLILKYNYCPFNTGYLDSNSEGSDSDLSDVGEVDSDVAAEQQKDYSRAVYREDMGALKQQRKAEMEPGQKRAQAPDQGLKLEFVHG